MNFFETNNALLFSKKSADACEDYETWQSFSPFMVNRYLSCYSPDMAVFANDTVNRYSQVSDDRTAVYRMYHYLIPKLKFKRINYVTKKNKKANSKDQDKDNTDYSIYARNNCLSKREVEASVAFYNKHCK